MSNFEFFKSEYKFYGKHARMVSELWYMNDYEHTFFKRLIDIIPIAAIIGFRMNRKAEADYSPVESKTVFLQQMLNMKEDLDFILQMMIMIEYAAELPQEEAVKRAFRGAETKEEYKCFQEMFDSYVRGGVEELYERLVIRKSDTDDEFYENKTANLMTLLNYFVPENKNSSLQM